MNPSPIADKCRRVTLYKKFAVYEVKVGKNSTQVKFVRINRKVNGSLSFFCENINTGKPTTLSNAQRFIEAVKTKPVSAEKKSRVREDGTMSAINTAPLLR